MADNVSPRSADDPKNTAFGLRPEPGHPADPPVAPRDDDPPGTTGRSDGGPGVAAELRSPAADAAAPHGRCAWDGQPLPRSAGRRPRQYCSDACKTAASRARRKEQITAVTAAVTESGAVLAEARPLQEALRTLVDRFAEKVDLAESGALARISAAEAEAAEDRADAAIAREQAAAADRARISAERRMREAEQAQRLAEEREGNARVDLERIGEKTRAEVLELGEKLGDAKRATELAEGVTADQANQLRALRTENRELQAARTALDDEFAERGRQLQTAQHTGAQLRTQLSEHSDRAAALALQLATATADATTAREGALATHAGLERVRQRHDEQTQHLRAELEAARQQAEARATELIRVQTLHEADQDLLAELRGQREDLKARHDALFAEVGKLRAEIDQLRARPGAAAEPEQDR
ncbi:DNA repair exonuclease SbcCD ATPase subunit [Streptosporangium album]|uniref:DNA repair exonuclease SbcCD ATPase subunit n=1 Tax=Streptosporangium album TaxID=47479 RepID=A0A7W7WDF2_9ACTN|nr:hypothetical protein [Streptosporangium album]MBB4943647.1 DNA repair exonuclease SbcCD ATPase subunit [Streptosporangium album]